MSTLVARKSPRGLVLPAGQPTIDWSNPITAGLVGCWVPTGEGGAVPVIRDLVTQQLMLPASGGGSIISSPLGMQAQDSSTTNVPNWSAAATAGQQPPSAFSVLWFGSIISNDNLGYNNPALLACPFGDANDSPWYSWGFERATGGTDLWLTYNFSGTYEQVTAPAVFPLASGAYEPLAPQAGYSFLGSVTSGGNGYIWGNGQLLVSTGAGSGSITYGTPSFVCVGSGFSGNNAGAGMCLGLLWNRQLSPAESAQISADPTSILIFPEDRLFYSVVGASAASVVLSPTAGRTIFAGGGPFVSTTLTLAPGYGRAIARGYVPSVLVSTTLYPGAGLVASLGKIPTLQISVSVAPSGGSTVFQGYTPQLAYPVTLTPGAGVLVGTGCVPVASTIIWNIAAECTALFPADVTTAIFPADTMTAVFSADTTTAIFRS